MNLFKHKKEKEKNNPTVQPNSSTTSNTNAKIAFLEQEKQMLKITLEHILKENEQLKNQLEDLKLTAQHNKLQLKEYVESITNKDKVVEKMNSTIELLQNRLNNYENYHKYKNSSMKQNNYNSFNTLTDEINQTSTKVNQSDYNTNTMNFGNNSLLDGSIMKESKTKVNTFYHKKQSKSTNFNIPNNSNNIQNTGNSNKDTDGVSNACKGTNSLYESPFQVNSLPKIKIPSIPINSTSSKSKNDFKFVNTNNIYLNKTTTSTTDPEKIKEISNKQQMILEEILNLKHDIQFILESTISKNKIKEKLNQSAIEETNKLNASVNNSFIDKQDKNERRNISSYSLFERAEDTTKFNKLQMLLDEYDVNKNIIFLIDNQGTCWELIRRSDVLYENIKEGKSIISILNKEYEKYIITNKLLDIDLKERENDESIIEVSRINDSVLI